MIVYDDIKLPRTMVMAAGLRVVMGRKNSRASSSNGQIAVNVQQDRDLAEFEFDAATLTLALVKSFIGIWQVTKAGAFGFLMQNPVESEVTEAEGVLAPYTNGGLVGTVGLGFGVPTYRLYKRYTAYGSTRTYDKRITRPMATPVIKRAASIVVPSIDLTTGLVTFTADASQAISAFITGGSSTTLVFANQTGIWAAVSAGQRVYVSGITGSMGTLLNNQSWVIASKGSNSLVITTPSSTGKSGTGGTAAKYPQASEALIWSGEYYTPVHYGKDDFNWNLARPGEDDSDRLYIGANVVLEEVPE